MKIVYIDLFSQDNSNKFWREAFEAHGEVRVYDCADFRRRPGQCISEIKTWRPTHIHYGGSVKTAQMFPLSYTKLLRKSCPRCRITAFRGDIYYNPYYSQLQLVADKVYVTNKSWARGVHAYMMCPGRKEFADVPRLEDRDIVFIGNANYEVRRRVISRLSKTHGVDVYGAGWTGVQRARGTISIEKCAQVYGRYKIAIDDVSECETCLYCNWSYCGMGDPDGLYTEPMCQSTACSKYTPIRGYFSNRMTNMLLSGVMVITVHQPGIEELFTNKKELVWVSNERELGEAFQYYLAHEEERKAIAAAGQQYALANATFTQAVKRILRVR